MSLITLFTLLLLAQPLYAQGPATTTRPSGPQMTPTTVSRAIRWIHRSQDEFGDLAKMDASDRTAIWDLMTAMSVLNDREGLNRLIPLLRKCASEEADQNMKGIRLSLLVQAQVAVGDRDAARATTADARKQLQQIGGNDAIIGQLFLSITEHMAILVEPPDKAFALAAAESDPAQRANLLLSLAGRAVATHSDAEFARLATAIDAAAAESARLPNRSKDEADRIRSRLACLLIDHGDMAQGQEIARTMAAVRPKWDVLSRLVIRKWLHGDREGAERSARDVCQWLEKATAQQRLQLAGYSSWRFLRIGLKESAAEVRKLGESALTEALRDPDTMFVTPILEAQGSAGDVRACQATLQAYQGAKPAHEDRYDVYFLTARAAAALAEAGYLPEATYYC